MSTNKLITVSMLLATTAALTACSPLSPSVSKFTSASKSTASSVVTSNIDHVSDTGTTTDATSTTVSIIPELVTDTGSEMISRDEPSTTIIGDTELSQLISTSETEIHTISSVSINSEEDATVLLIVKNDLSASQKRSIRNNLHIKIVCVEGSHSSTIHITVAANEDVSASAAENAKKLLFGSLVNAYLQIK